MQIRSISPSLLGFLLAIIGACLGETFKQNSCPNPVLNGCDYGPTSLDVLNGLVTSYPTPQVPSAAYGIFTNHSDVRYRPLGTAYTRLSTTPAVSIEQCCVSCQSNSDCSFWSFKPRYPVTKTDALGYCYLSNAAQCLNTAASTINLFSYDDDTTNAAASFSKCAQCPPVPTKKVHLPPPPLCTPYVEPTRGTWVACPDYASSCAVAPTSANLPACIGSPLVNYVGEYSRGTLDDGSSVLNLPDVTIEQCASTCKDHSDQCSAFSWKQTAATTGYCVVYDLSLCSFDQDDYTYSIPNFDTSKQNAYTFHTPC